MLLAGHRNPMVEDAEIECSLGRLDLLPCNRHQNRIQMHLRESREDAVGLRRCARGRISQLSAKE